MGANQKGVLFDHVFEVYKNENTKEYIDIDLELDTPSHFESKVGGVPYLDSNFDVPKTNDGTTLRFMAQFDFSDLPLHNLPLPKSGLLQFWLLDNDMMGLGEDGEKCIRYYETIDKTITEEEILKHYEEREIGMDNCFMLEKTYRPSFSVKEELMSQYDESFDEIFINLWNTMFYDDQIERIRELDDIFKEKKCDDTMNMGHKLGGYPFFTQYDPRDSDRSKYEFLLFQLDSDFKVDFDILWGDAGVGNFFISEEDLKQLNFDDVLYNWDCH